MTPWRRRLARLLGYHAATRTERFLRRWPLMAAGLFACEYPLSLLTHDRTDWVYTALLSVFVGAIVAVVLTSAGRPR